jgi:diguanylate cyclase (GGDEF)-like protein/PAS domain S-box-containing protein
VSEQGVTSVSILVVEDDPDMRDALRDFLLEGDFSGGVEVDQAASFEDALEHLSNREYGVLLIDHQLGGKGTGLDLLREARKRGIRSSAIVITGQGHEAIAVEAMKAGAADYLMKANLTPEAVHRSIARAVELVRTDRLRREAEKKLRESEERHRALLENSYDAIMLIDRGGTVRYASPATTRLLGYAPDDVVGRESLSFVHPDDREQGRRLMDQCALTPGAVVRGELRMTHRDGSWRWMEGIGTNRLADLGIEGLIVNFRDVSDRKDMESARSRLEEHIHFQAFHDSLTGLPNRNLFEDRLALAIARADRYAEGLCVMFLDLDHFKDINDSHGHAVGDGLLQAVANRLRGSVRDHDSVARIGGDEFLILFPELGDPEDAERVGRKLLNQFSRPFSVRGLSLTMTASIGIALYRTHGNTSEELLRNADASMYRAKDLGRNRTSINTSRNTPNSSQDLK